MSRDGTPAWSFLTNQAQVLLCIAHDPGIRLREIGEAVGITERAAHRIVVELAAAGYISRKRNGRRVEYTSNPTCATLGFDAARGNAQVGRSVRGGAASARRRRAAAPSEARSSSLSLVWLAARPP